MHLSICSRLKKQTTFSGHKYSQDNSFIIVLFATRPGTLTKLPREYESLDKHNVNVSQPASNLPPLLARQRNAIRMAFRWRADSSPILRAYWDGFSQYSKYNVQSNPVKTRGFIRILSSSNYMEVDKIYNPKQFIINK